METGKQFYKGHAGFSEGSAPTQIAGVSGDGSFSFQDVPLGKYFVQVQRPSDDYVGEISFNAQRLPSAEIEVQAGANRLDITLSSGAGSISATVQQGGESDDTPPHASQDLWTFGEFVNAVAGLGTEIMVQKQAQTQVRLKLIPDANIAGDLAPFASFAPLHWVFENIDPRRSFGAVHPSRPVFGSQRHTFEIRILGPF
jgi:hypothetical protein